MKLFAILCAVGVALATSTGSNSGSSSGSKHLHKTLWTPGSEYEFRYEGRQLTGIPSLNSQYSGMGIRADVRVQVERQMQAGSEFPDTYVFTVKVLNPTHVTVNDQLTQVDNQSAGTTAQRNWRNVVLPAYRPVTGEAKRLLEQPTQFRFDANNGQFHSMVVGQGEAVWAVNFKKAICVLFQTKGVDTLNPLDGSDDSVNSIVNNGIGSSDSNGDSNQQIMDTMSYWTTLEDGLDGTCSVEYQLNQIPQEKAEQMSSYFSERCRTDRTRQKYVLIKTRNIDTCTQRRTYSFYKPGYFRCAGAGEGNCEGQWTRSSFTRYYLCDHQQQQGQQQQQNLLPQMRVESILNEGELQQDLFAQKTESFTTGAQQFLFLVAKRPIGQQIPKLSSGQGKTIKSLSYGVESKKDQLQRQQQLTLDHQDMYGSPIQAISGIEKKSIFEPRSILSQGIKGKRVGQSPSGEVKSQIKQLISQLIDQDLVNPTGRPEKEISMKALNLARGFSIFDQQGLQQLYQEMKQTYSHDQEKLTTFKNIFFDTVVMSGTENSVLFIKEKIEQGELATQQMINYFVFLPHYLATPYERVLENVFQLIKSQKIKQENKIVYNQAVLSFSALIQRACLSQTRESTYPTQVYGEFCSPSHPIVQEKWIPYLQREIFSNEQEAKIKPEWRNLHLMSIGIMKHRAVLPTILEILDTQEESNQEFQANEATRLTRFLAVYSLSNAGKVEPKRIVRVLSAILKNQAERIEVRIAAFNSILKLNPELYVLQSIAAMTWRESNTELINIINSGYFFLANQRQLPIFEEFGSSIQRKAALVLPLLKWSRDLSQATFYTADKLDMLEVSYSNIRSLRYGPNTNPMKIMPTDYYARMTYLLSRYQYTSVETIYRMEGFDNAIQQLVEVLVPSAEKKTKSQVGDKILETLGTQWKQTIQKLNIKRRDSHGTQGAIFMNLFEDFPIFASVQSTTSQMLKEKLSQVMGSSGSNSDESLTASGLKSKVCGNHKVNMQRMMNLGPAEFMVPSELGFPIVVEVHAPVTVSLRGSLDVDCSQESEIVPSFTLDTRVLVVSQYTGWVGTVCPFTEEVLLTSADAHHVMDLPFKTTVKYQTQQQKLQVSVAISQHQKSQHFDLVHIHTRPFTCRSAVSSLKPFGQLPQDQFKPIKSRTQKWSHAWDLSPYLGGLGVRASLQTESRHTELLSLFMRKAAMYNYNLVNVLRFPFASTGVSERGQPSLRTHLIKLQYDPQINKVEQVTANIAVGYAVKKTGQPAKYVTLQKDEQAKTSQKQFPLDYPAYQKIVPVKVQQKPLSQQISGHAQRQQKLEQSLQKSGVESGRGICLHFDIATSGQQQSHFEYDLTVTSGQQTQQTLNTKWDAELNGPEGQKVTLKGHIQPTGAISGGKIPSDDIEEIRSNRMEYEIYSQLTSKSSQNGQEGQLTVTGKAETSPEQIQFSRNSKQAKQYQQLKQQNATLAEISKVASLVREQASALDRVHLKLQYQNLPYGVYVNMLVNGYVKSQWWPFFESVKAVESGSSGSSSGSSSSSSGSETNEWNIRFNPNTNSLSANLTEERYKTNFEYVQLPYYASYFLPLNGLSQAQIQKGQTGPASRYHQCQLSGNLVRTYENRILPANIDTCLHVMTGDYSKSLSFQVLVKNERESTSQTSVPRFVQINYLGTEIKVGTNQQGNVYAMANNTHINIKAQGATDVVDQEGNLIAIVNKGVERNSCEVATVFNQHGSRQAYVTMKYFGNRVVVNTDDYYKGTLTGMCGEISGDKLFDLRGPQKCLFSKPELLALSYRVGSTEGNQCQPPKDQQLQQQLQREQQQCIKKKHIHSQVSKSYKSEMGECTRHVHLILEKPGSLCVSKRPVPQCGGICKPVGSGNGSGSSGLTEKKVSYACLPRESKMAKLIKAKVQKGEIVISELSGLPSKAEMTLQLPKACEPFTIKGY